MQLEKIQNNAPKVPELVMQTILHAKRKVLDFKHSIFPLTMPLYEGDDSLVDAGISTLIF